MVCRQVPESASQTHSKLSRSAEMILRESIITTSAVIGNVWPFRYYYKQSEFNIIGFKSIRFVNKSYPESCDHYRLTQSPNHHRFVLGSRGQHLTVRRKADTRHHSGMSIQRRLQHRCVDLPQLHWFTGGHCSQLRVSGNIKACGRLNVGRIQSSHGKWKLTLGLSFRVALQMWWNFFVSEWVECDFVAA